MTITNTTGTERYACSSVHFTGGLTQVHLLQDGTPVAMMYHKDLSWEEAQRVYGLAKALVQKLNRGDSRKEESLQQMATAWEKVFLTLCKVCPGWNEGESTAMDLAVKCIEQLANPPAQAAHLDTPLETRVEFALRDAGFGLDEASNLAALATRQPTQAAQMNCNMGVGCDEAGVCYADAHGQPEQCGRTPADPVAQGEAVAWVMETHRRKITEAANREQAKE